jgi:hypothetical protein
MEAFMDVLYDWNPSDIGFLGISYMYDNKWAWANVRVRLDRAIIFPSWCDLFEDTCVQHLASLACVHCLILIKVT